MFKKLLFASVLITFACGIEVTKSWESKPLLQVPESVLLDSANKRLFVANINGQPLEKDGNGFISILDLNGKITSLQFAKGFDAPKGMALFHNKLYVSDITTLRVVDLESGKIIENYPIEDAEFLNDVAVTKDGTVYVSDFSSTNQSVYKLENKKISKWLDSTDLDGERPNGLWITNNELMIGTKEGTIFGIDLKTKELSLFQREIGKNGIDGLLPYDQTSYITSDWAGKVFISNGETSIEILDQTPNKINAADIWYDRKTHKLYVPTFFDNRIICYDIKK